MMSLSDIRKAFLSFFEKKGHTKVASSSLIPTNDETLLFTNAGMVQFKEVFLGQESRSYDKATTSQRCVRAGGKHNDLENVGYTTRHHTFFEMLGNFSFGDYFKKQAIEFAWEFLTQELKLPKEKLWISVYHDDKEAEDIWLNDIKIDPQRISRCGEKDNFWSMGDTGPCGPCTEIFYDHGPNIFGGPPGSPDQDGDRYTEIWNLVFMQFNRAADGTLSPLPKQSVDTGMGLERLATVLQGVQSNYQIDLFQYLIKAAAKIARSSDLTNPSLQVLADHIRSCSFLIMDGVIPSNEGRGYVLRRIIRRAIRHGKKLEVGDVFFYKLVQPLVDQMGEAYPELKVKQNQIEKILEKEEIQFIKTLEQGLTILEQDLKQLGDLKTIPGALVFKLYDTYGFPMDLTRDIAREKGLTIDEAGFESEMEKQRARARGASQFSMDYNEKEEDLGTSHFSGYEGLNDEGLVVMILKDGKKTEVLNEGDSAAIVLDKTPFYAESGGQVGDQGVLLFSSGRFEVSNTKKSENAHLHYGVLKSGVIKQGDKLQAQVNKKARQATMLNHSATHLLHAALREVIGPHVTQKGSLVSPEKLRFDFAHYEGLTAEQIETVENLVNEKIRENTSIHTELMNVDEAMKSGAMALFGEKYSENVRVLKMGDGFSVELCGGTHAHRTGDIGLMRILFEAGIASGIRRIEAITGASAFAWFKESDEKVKYCMDSLKSDRENLEVKLQDVLSKVKKLERENQDLKLKLVSGAGSSSGLSAEAVDIGPAKVLVKKLAEGSDPNMLRELVDSFKNKLGSAVIVLGLVENNKVSLIAGVSKDCTDRLKAGELVNFVAGQVGGKGGGRPDIAQAGGNQPENLDKALNSVLDWVKEKMV